MRFHLNFLTLTLLLSADLISCDTRYCNDGLGVCTPFTKCSNLTVFNDGSDHINVRFNIELETDACHYLEMCCDPEDVLTDEWFGETQNQIKPVDLDLVRGQSGNFANGQFGSGGVSGSGSASGSSGSGGASGSTGSGGASGSNQFGESHYGGTFEEHGSEYGYQGNYGEHQRNVGGHQQGFQGAHQQGFGGSEHGSGGSFTGHGSEHGSSGSFGGSQAQGSSGSQVLGGQQGVGTGGSYGGLGSGHGSGGLLTGHGSEHGSSGSFAGSQAQGSSGSQVLGGQQGAGNGGSYGGLGSGHGSGGSFTGHGSEHGSSGSFGGSQAQGSSGSQVLGGQQGVGTGGSYGGHGSEHGSGGSFTGHGSEHGTSGSFGGSQAQGSSGSQVLGGQQGVGTDGSYGGLGSEHGSGGSFGSHGSEHGSGGSFGSHGSEHGSGGSFGSHGSEHGSGGSFGSHGSEHGSGGSFGSHGSHQVGHHEEHCNQLTHECIPYFFCLADHTTDGSNILNSRSGEGKCTINSQVCCEKKDNINRYEPKTCGTRNKAGIGYTVTNSVDEAQFAEFPWMAAITEILANGEGQYICGGSLIDPHVILTAAHCVHNKDPSHLIIRLGEWDTQTTSEAMPHSDHEVIKIIAHKEFGPTNLFNDIALMVLKNPVRRSAHINTVCLPTINQKFEGECLASGWGTDVFGRPDRYRVNLKKLELPVVPLRDCQESLRTTKLGPKFKIHTSFMCAGGERDIDTCTGDGGSPLVCPIPGHEDLYYQAGIVAWGIECGIENVPGVYANVAKFRHWIDAHMTELGYGTGSYTL